MLLGLRSAEQLVLLPVFLWAWGTAAYGDWLRLLAAASFAALLDAGLSGYGASALHFARARGRQARHARLFSLVLTGAIACLALTLLVAAGVGALIAAGGAPAWLAPGTLALGEAGLAFALLAAAMPMPGLLAALAGPLRANGRHGAFLRGQVLVRLASMCGTAAVLGAGGGPAAAAAAMMLAHAALGALLLAATLRRHAPDVRWRPGWPEGREAARHLRRLPPFAMIAAAGVGTRHVPVVLLAMLGAGPAVLVTFAAARTLTGLLRQGVQLVAGSVAVETAQARAAQGSNASAALASQTLSRLWPLTGIGAGLLMGAGGLLLTVWTGGHAAPDPWLLAVLVLPVVLTVPFQIRSQGLAAANRARAIANAGIAHIGIGCIFALKLAGALPPAHLAAAVMAGFAAAEVLVYALSLPRKPPLAGAGGVAALAAVLFLAAWAAAYLAAGAASALIS
ncbi:hypothetical protein [Futiania mangrovi]|uniref:Polysaccharide biosynthesis protein n=1 Tax=Futiania mangrovi TaxID=2959716 RepID=A0A9J6P7W7_9PROT|nr:hypothetical protein [Futiania mangrovii]MCP1335364.1 hypothetical protein [Futiania mangrovii]